MSEILQGRWDDDDDDVSLINEGPCRSIKFPEVLRVQQVTQVLKSVAKAKKSAATMERYAFTGRRCSRRWLERLIQISTPQLS